MKTTFNPVLRKRELIDVYVYVCACAILQVRKGCVQSHLNSITVNKSDLSFSVASRNKLLNTTNVVMPMITLKSDL